jgi:hypothetical protein
VFEQWAERVTAEGSELPGWAQRVLTVAASHAEIGEDTLTVKEPAQIERTRGWKGGAILLALEQASILGFVTEYRWDPDDDVMLVCMALPKN